MVNIAASHAAARGSIPRIRTFYIPNLLELRLSQHQSLFEKLKTMIRGVKFTQNKATKLNRKQ